MKTPIQTLDAPAAIGSYSQAVRAGDTVYVSGQIGFAGAVGSSVVAVIAFSYKPSVWSLP